MPPRISDCRANTEEVGGPIVTFLVTIIAYKGTKATRIFVWLDIRVSDLSGVYHSTANVLPRNSDRKASIKGLSEIICF